MSDPGFSFPVRLEDIPAAGRRVEIAPDAAAREKIAARLNVPAVKSLSGALDLAWRGAELRISGRLDAILERVCVASLEPMEEVVAEAIDLRFGRADGGEEAALDLDPDAPEPLEGDSVDLAEILVQELALAMAAWPRKSGAAALAEAHGQAGTASPFEALRGAFTARGDKE